MGVVLIVELFRLFPDALTGAFADGWMVIEGLGNIRRGYSQLFGKVVDRRSFLGSHDSVFNIEQKLNVRNKS